MLISDGLSWCLDIVSIKDVFLMPNIMSNLFSAFFLCVNPLNVSRMFSHFASDYAELSNCFIFFLKKYLILLLIIPVLLSGFSNLFVC